MFGGQWNVPSLMTNRMFQAWWPTKCSNVWWPMECFKLGGQQNVLMIGGQWNVPSLVANGR
jgi:hypothetical protein